MLAADVLAIAFTKNTVITTPTLLAQNMGVIMLYCSNIYAAYQLQSAIKSTAAAARATSQRAELTLLLTLDSDLGLYSPGALPTHVTEFF